MKYQRLLFLTFIFFIQAHLASGQISCDNNIGNYTRNSAYSANLNATLSSLSTNVDNNGFYNISIGQGIERANGIVLCKGDVQLNACRECAQESAAELLKSCPNQKQAIRWDASCMLRYSNDTMYGNLATSPGWYLWNQVNATSPEQFKEDLRKLLDDLRNQAASGGSLRKVAAGNATGPDFQTIFALVQCTPDLSREDCTSCLIGAISEIPMCCDRKRGGRVLRPSCNLRFEIYPFFNETRLQELEPVPAPVPAPGPVIEPPLQSPPGKDDGNTTRTVIIIVPSIVVCLILAISAIILLRKRKKQRLIANPENEISTAESLQYAFSTIKAATNDFSENNKLGQGGFGTVYKAWKNWRDGTAANVVDPFLRSGSGSISEMLRCIHIGLLSVQENAADRPTMASVVLMLSSLSITLAVPSEPAFYFPSGYSSHVSCLQQYNSRNSERDTTTKPADQSDQSSQNDASITELYPR